MEVPGEADLGGGIHQGSEETVLSRRARAGGQRGRGTRFGPHPGQLEVSLPR